MLLHYTVFPRFIKIKKEIISLLWKAQQITEPYVDFAEIAATSKC